MRAHDGASINHEVSKPITVQGVVTTFRDASPHPHGVRGLQERIGNAFDRACLSGLALLEAQPSRVVRA